MPSALLAWTVSNGQQKGDLEALKSLGRQVSFWQRPETLGSARFPPEASQCHEMGLTQALGSEDLVLASRE